MARSKRLDDTEILQSIASHPDPVVTATEMADRLDYSADGMRNRLQELAEEGYIIRRDVGSRATVWWITTSGRQQLD